MKLQPRHTRLYHLHIVYGLLALIFSLPSHATDTLITRTTHPHYLLTNAIQYLEDKTGTLSLSEVTSPTSRSRWQDIQATTPNFGVTQSTYWLALPIFNSDTHKSRWLLEIANPNIDSIEFYAGTDLGTESSITHRFDGGNQYPFSQRYRQDPHFLFPVSIEPQQTVWIYLRIKSANMMKLPLSLWQEEAYNKQRTAELMIQGGYFGIMAIMALYNLFVYFSLRDKSYLYYVIFVTTFSSWMFIEKGLAFQYIWPNGIWQNAQLYPVLASLGTGMTAIFANEYLSLKHNHPTYYRILYALSALWIAIALCALVLPIYVSMKLITAIAFPGGTLLLFAGLLMWKEGLVAAKYYTIAWITMIIGGLTFSLLSMGFVPYNIFTENALQVGLILEVVLLSLGLANRINTTRREKDAALLESVELRSKMQTFKLSFQQKLNKNLEERIQERTKELETALTELAESNKKLHIVSVTDGLTQVKNRRYFDEKYPIEWRRAHRENQPISLIIIDIDFFKKVNDTYGHSAGDECLRVVASELKQLVKRPADAISRFGGEEFVVTLPNTNSEGAYHIAEIMRKHIETLHVATSNHRLQMTISAGVATTTPTTDEKPETLFCLADEALYTAKEAGRNRVVANTLA